MNVFKVIFSPKKGSPGVPGKPTFWVEDSKRSQMGAAKSLNSTICKFSGVHQNLKSLSEILKLEGVVSLLERINQILHLTL